MENVWNMALAQSCQGHGFGSHLKKVSKKSMKYLAAAGFDMDIVESLLRMEIRLKGGIGEFQFFNSVHEFLDKFAFAILIAFSVTIPITLAMVAGMRIRNCQHKVLNPIIRFVTILVMHNFPRLKATPKMLSHYKAMLSNIASIVYHGLIKTIMRKSYKNITIFINSFAAFPIWDISPCKVSKETSTRAVFAPFGSLALFDKKYISAILTGAFNWIPSIIPFTSFGARHTKCSLAFAITKSYPPFLSTIFTSRPPISSVVFISEFFSISSLTQLIYYIFHTQIIPHKVHKVKEQ